MPRTIVAPSRNSREYAETPHNLSNELIPNLREFHGRCTLPFVIHQARGGRFRIGYSHSTMTDDIQHGRPLAVAPDAQSASPTEPAFIARPEGAPVYYGFVVLNDVIVDGFTLGKITDFEAVPCDEGDAFVIAPDGSRAGLVWEICDTAYFREVMPIEAGRWGVWGVGFPVPMNSRESARKNLASILPELKSRWMEWKPRFQGGGAP
jgi:hypothetical protein